MIEVSNLHAFRGSRSVLSEVNFKLAAGQCLALVGPNGSGKSSMLQCVFQLLEYTGLVLLDGRDARLMSRLELARSIGYLPQSVSSLPPFSVRHFVALGRYAEGYRLRVFGNREDRVVVESMELTQVRELADAPLEALSGGQLKRVLLAAVLAQQSPILLLDEPAASLDPQQEERFFSVLSEAVQQRRCAVMLASHNINQSVRVADLVLGLRSGQTRYQGAAAEVANTPEHLTNVFGIPFRVINDPEHEFPLVVPNVA